MTRNHPRFRPIPTRLRRLLREHHEALLLGAAVILLALALVKPQVRLERHVHNYLLLADVSQSMNAEDVELDGKPVTRMAYMRHLMKRVVETAPCGTYVSLGVYADVNTALLFMPLEVCANYDVIVDAIGQLEWRMAWRGHSRISYGIRDASGTLDSQNAPARLLFFTDGDEAPKVDVISKLDLNRLPGGENIILVGVGGHEPVPIPRYNTANEWIGFWSSDTQYIGANVTYSDTGTDEPDPLVAYAEFDRYLSQLEDEYLRGLAGEIRGQYVEGRDTEAFYAFVHGQPSAGVFVALYPVAWLYLSLAGLLVLLTFVPDGLFRWRERRSAAAGKAGPGRDTPARR
jgi:mxaL protein